MRATAITRTAGFGLVLGLLFATVLVQPARAAYPGQNGKIAYVSGGIWTMGADGSNRVQITTGTDWDPAWSPDGERIAFLRSSPPPCPCGAIHVVNADGSGDTTVVVSSSGYVMSPTWSSDGERIAFTMAGDIWIVGADGSGPTRVTTSAEYESGLSWSPDGKRIAFDADGGIFSVRPDGSDRRTIVPPANPDWLSHALYPDWSPDGSRIVYEQFDDCDGDYTGNLVTVRPDGTGRRHVRGGDVCSFTMFDQPSWSPDGSSITSSDFSSFASTPIFTVNVDGSGYFDTGVDGEQPDWQPLPVDTPSSHVRPAGATPFRAPLVPAAQECTAPNRTHAEPLAFPSCNPPVPGSPNLTVGVGDGDPSFARSIGFVRLSVRPGVPGGVDDAAVVIRSRLSNVMRVSDLSEYTGDLRASVQVRLTDKQGTVSQTTQDFALEWEMPCTPTAEELDKSLCELTTTLDALIPGAAAEGTRANWALDQVEVYDGGPDEDAGTSADNSLLAVQGVFVP